MTTHLFYGVPGTGKTQAMADIVAAHSDEQLFHISDITNDWFLDKTNKRWRGKVPRGIVLGAAERQEWVDTGKVQAVEDFIEESPSGLLVYQTPWEPWEVAQYAKSVGNCFFVCDEIDTVAAYKDWATNPLRDIVHRGRHIPNRDGIMGIMGIYGACRRPQSLHTDITSLADEIFVFRVAGKRTIDRLVGDSVISPTEEDSVTLLPNFHYLRWENTGVRESGKLLSPFK